MDLGVGQLALLDALTFQICTVIQFPVLFFKVGIKIITVIHEQVDRVVILAPVWPILKFVQFIHQLTDTEPRFDPMHQLRFLVKNLDCWTFSGVVVPALSYQILIKI